MATSQKVESSYRIERLDLSQLDSVKKLHFQIYGWMPDAESFKRKYSTEKLGLPVIGYIAYDLKDEAVAYYGVFPVSLVLDDKHLLAAQSGDTMTHPAHQGKGLFTSLARRTYECAANEGVAFVFGFPNKNSYPGFVKKLGWQHKKTMHSYNFLVPTLPIGELAEKFKVLRPVFQSFQSLGIAALGGLAPTVLENSVLEPGVGGVLRDAAFLNYKSAGLRCLDTHGVKIYFKLGRFVDLGDIYISKNGNLKAALHRLKWLAFFAGIVRIRFYVSPQSVVDRHLMAISTPRDGLPYGYVGFDSAVNPDNFAFAFIDYDTF